MTDAAPKRFTLSTGGWVDLPAEMTGGDFLAIRQVMRHQGANTPDDLEAIVAILRDNVVDSSEDVLRLPLSECIELVFRWYIGVDDDAVPPVTGTN